MTHWRQTPKTNNATAQSLVLERLRPAPNESLVISLLLDRAVHTSMGYARHLYVRRSGCAAAQEHRLRRLREITDSDEIYVETVWGGLSARGRLVTTAGHAVQVAHFLWIA